MKIWIDADACPRAVKDILFRASTRLQVPLCLVANKSLAKHSGPRVEIIVVAEGFDVADNYIAAHAAPDDLVVTADVPLAARIVGKGGVALDPRGELYREESIGDRLALRDLMSELRDTGLIQGGGPPPFSMSDRNRFASTLDSVLHRMLRGQRPG
ncbi:MAG: YaiI/YqxD family protein [Deltaproteobacteria bacterium]|nr:MAG: YaiI/YqxD family protein [Deltaproteobacteria bacterium]